MVGEQGLKSRTIYAPLDIDYQDNPFDMQYGYGRLVDTIGSKWYKYMAYTLGLLCFILFLAYNFYIVKDAKFLDRLSADESFRDFAPLITLGILGIAMIYCILACFCKVELYQYGFVVKQFFRTKKYCYEDISQISHSVAVEEYNPQRLHSVWLPEFLRTTDIYFISFKNTGPMEIKSDIYFRLKSKMTSLQQNLVDER